MFGFDKIILTCNLKRYFERYEPIGNIIDSVQEKFVNQNNSATLKIVLSPWAEGESIFTKLLTRRFKKKGYSYLIYSFPRYILASDANLTIENFFNIAKLIKSKIVFLQQKYKFQKIHVIAPSLGVISACLIANGNKDITNLFFLAPGASLALSFWDGIRTQGLKKIYQGRNITRSQLENLWMSVAPKNNINALSDKEIFVAISQSDKVIPYHYGKEFANLLRKQYHNTIIEENRALGHYLTILKYYCFSKALLG